MQEHLLQIIKSKTHPRKSQSRNKRSERGQSLVEFSFILVFLLILLAGIADLGRAMFTYITLRDAAQEGALYASINPTATSAIVNRVINSSSTVQGLAVYDEGEPAPLSVDVSYSGTACSGNGVRVSVTYHKFPITMPFLGTLLGQQHVRIKASIIDTIITPPCY